jgi:hypothetical protein
MMGIVNQLPLLEREFIIQTASELMLQNQGNLEQTLRGIVSFQGELDYGWEEAVLSENWYRYPGEIEKMRFCSEWALKNFLLARAMSLPAQYVIVENYCGTNLPHEMVLVPNGSLYLLDWELYSVSQNKGAFKSPKEEITFSRIYEIPEAEVMRRVERLRSSESFLEALISGQYLAVRNTPRGVLEIFVQYDPKTSALEYWHILYSFSGRYNFYFRYRIYANSQKEEEVGVLSEKNGRSFKTIPVMDFQNRQSVRKFFLKDELPQFNEAQRRAFLLQIILACAFRENDDFSFSPENRLDNLNRIEKYAYDQSKQGTGTCRRVVEDYRRLAQKNPEAAERFLDGFQFELQADQLKLEEADLFKCASNCCNLDSLEGAFKEGILISMRELAETLSLSDLSLVQQKLQDAVVSQIGINAFRYKPPKAFDLLNKIMEEVKREDAERLSSSIII